jgi:integrase
MISRLLVGRNVRVREGIWHYRFNLDGKERTGSTGLAGIEQNRKAAEEFAKGKRKELRRQDRGGGQKGFAAGASEFLTWCEAVEYRAKRSTAARIKVSFASAVAFFGAAPIETIDAGAIERYKSHRIMEHGVRDVTLRHDLHALSLFFARYAMKMGWTKVNPVKEVTMPSDEDAVRIHVVTPAEQEVYFARAFSVQDRAGLRNLYDVATLMLNQGCRPEEIMASRKESFREVERELFISGGKSRAARRTLRLTEDSFRILRARMQTPGPWLFPSDRRPGRHITKLQYSHDRVCLDACVSFVLYDFRHTFGTIQGTVLKLDPFTLAALMGHANLRTIMRYVHPQEEQKQAAMQAYEAVLQRRRLKVVGE